MTFVDSDGPEQFHEAIDNVTTAWGVRLNEIMVEEAMIRPDGLGTAVDTGGLTDSLSPPEGILEDEWNYIVVGTNIEYAPKLARGIPDPDTDYDNIYGWAKRKRLPPMKKGYRKKSKARALFVRNVVNKLTTEGPIPNPFDERAAKRFLSEWEDIAIREGLLE